MIYSPLPDYFQTSRLILKTPRLIKEEDLLSFYVVNRQFHAPWESVKDEVFYTAKSMKELLENQIKRENSGTTLDLYLTLPDSSQIIGTLSLSNITPYPFCSTYVGYRLAKKATGFGYMREALLNVIEIGKKHYNLHRFEANIVPRNVRSKHLVESVGFQCEGVSPHYLHIAGKWEDHEHYVYLVKDWEKR